MLSLEYNKNLPVFPSYNTIKTQNTVLFESSVYVHIDAGSHIQIFKYPIRELYGTPTEKVSREIKDSFKRTCLRYYKYLDLNNRENRKSFIFIESISKFDENFEELIYNTYL